MDITPLPGSALLPVTIIGTQPLLMSNSLAVMKQGAIGQRLGELTKLRRRTTVDEAELRKIKYMLALYYDEKLGVFLPGYNLWTSILNGAKFHKKGKDFERGAVVIEEKLKLEFDGSKLSPDELYEDGRFIDIRPARVSGKSMIEAVRPIFPSWSLKATLAVNDAFANLSDVRKAAEIAGLTEGLGTWRRRFGRFEVSFGETTVAKEEKRKAA
jgi:hypothetical protein